MVRVMPLDAEQMHAESQTMQGALGAVAYVVLKGLQAAGAKDELVASFRVIMHEHFQRLTDADANALCDVAWRRFQEESKKQRWY
jgi:hypothetical protein